MKIVLFAVLSLFPSVTAFCQDKPELDFQVDLQVEKTLLKEESRILSEILNAGQVDEAFIKGYPKILRENVLEPSEREKRIQVLGVSIENGLIYQSRFDVITEDELKHPGIDPDFDELNHRIETSPVTQDIRNQVMNFQNQILERVPIWNEVAPKTATSNQGKFYVMWGYNRAWFGKTDSTFKTQEGEFTVHDSVGKDRPSPFDPKIYFNPSTLSIPQYNLTIGYWFKERFGLEIGHDHMKWVFDNQRRYEFSGEFNPTLYVHNPNSQHGWDGVRPASFEEIKQTGDATWLSFEHTNGYNYVFAALVFLQPLYQSRNGNFAIDSKLGAGGGVMIPQTSVHMHRDHAWNWEGYDNQFHLAGGGGHASAGVKLTAFDRVFFEATARGSLIKVSNALVDQSGAILTQTPIAALELMGQIGYQGSLSRKKRSRRNGER